MPQPFADFYSRWLSHSVVQVPTERELNCRECKMVWPQGATRDAGPFRADLKCCTYFPFLPNFTVGALLANGHGKIDEALSLGHVTPLGLFAPPGFGTRDFGQRPEMLCPFFDRAKLGCSIWSYRPGVCSSYVCQSSEGARGLASWAKLESWVNLFEWTLAHEVVWRLGFTKVETDLMTPPAATEVCWAEHRQRKPDFFLECYDLAQSVTPPEIAELMC